ncbi:MAG: hypothetical protein R2830_06420 [Saprospiraceae bacterium]
MPHLESATAQHGITALPGHINSSQPDIAPLRYADKLYFTSVFQKDKKSAPLNRLESARLAGGEVKILDENPADGNSHAANMALMPDASRMYYSICEDGDVFHQHKCTLWCRDKTYEGDWAAARKLPKHINQKDGTATQPSIGFDKELKKYVLYFVSDRPGGKGGMDIWASTLEPNGEFGALRNLPFNTSGDDVTPFFDAASQSLFFSSNGLFGIGGYDIYQVEKSKAGDWQQPENLGELVNTRDDELYFTFHNQTKHGYFASNRPHVGNNEKQMDKADFDIYEMEVVIEIELLALDEETTIPITGTMAEVWVKGSERPFIFREQPFDEGLWMQLDGGREYHIIVRAKGYAPTALELDSDGMMASMSIRRKVFLRKEYASMPDGEAAQKKRIAYPAKFFNTSPKSVMKEKNEELLGLPF